MAAQHGRWEATGSGAGVPVAVLALSPGEGFDAIFESLGAHPARLGDIVKPAAGDIAAAANALRVPDVIVLPNHKNVLLAAQQAAQMARCSLSVVPTSSVPQGIAAALAFDPARPLRENLEHMREALEDVVTIEVTTAATDRRAEGLSVKAGDAIGLLNGRLVTRADDPVEALVATLNRAAEDGAGLITLYAGANVSAEDLERARRAIVARFRDATVEALSGGQALYHFIASLER
jgi:dihydroxyacetone kinase-like predicted kinase